MSLPTTGKIRVLWTCTAHETSAGYRQVFDVPERVNARIGVTVLHDGSSTTHLGLQVSVSNKMQVQALETRQYIRKVSGGSASI